MKFPLQFPEELGLCRSIAKLDIHRVEFRQQPYLAAQTLGIICPQNKVVTGKSKYFLSFLFYIHAFLEMKREYFSNGTVSAVSAEFISKDFVANYLFPVLVAEVITQT